VAQWHCPASTGCITAYLAFKWLVAIYLVTGLLLNWVDLRILEEGLEWPSSLTHRAKWFVYVTNWASLILTVQAVLAAVLASDYHFTPDAPTGGKIYKNSL
jgi:hypothetical protein